MVCNIGMVMMYLPDWPIVPKCIATRGVAMHLGTIVNEQKKKFQLSLQQDNFLKFKILRIYIFSMVDNQSFC